MSRRAAYRNSSRCFQDAPQPATSDDSAVIAQSKPGGAVCGLARCFWFLAFGVMPFELLHQTGQAAVQGGGNPDDAYKIGGRSTSLDHRNVGAPYVGRQGQRDDHADPARDRRAARPLRRARSDRRRTHRHRDRRAPAVARARRPPDGRRHGRGHRRCAPPGRRGRRPDAALPSAEHGCGHSGCGHRRARAPSRHPGRRGRATPWPAWH